MPSHQQSYGCRPAEKHQCLLLHTIETLVVCYVAIADWHTRLQIFKSPFPCGSACKESTCNAGDLGLIHELGRSPGEERGYPLQYSGLENPMDGRVVKSRIGLSDFDFIWQVVVLNLEPLGEVFLHFISAPPLTSVLLVLVSEIHSLFYSFIQ